MAGLIYSLALIGFTAVIAQVVLMRELMVVFHGNELALGCALAGWFFWTAVGSSLLARLSARAGNRRVTVACLQALAAAAFPSGILATRFSRSMLRALPGETLGPVVMLLGSLGILSLFCAVSGWLFSEGSRLYGDEVRRSAAEAAGSLYIIEAAGAVAGGLLAGVALIRYLTPFQIAALLAFLSFVSAVVLVFRSRSRLRWILVAAMSLCAAAVFPPAAGRLEAWSLRILWKGFDLQATHNSIYGNIAVTATEGNRSLYENGIVIATAPDLSASEEAVHYALLQHPAPRRLLLIGGGLNGALGQALQHPGIDFIDYVELDASIFGLARRYFSHEWTQAEADPRIRLHAVDGRLFLKNAAQSYDVIIVSLPDPQTAQLNRFYTAEFFGEAAGKLNPGGVFSFQAPGAENYISPQLADLLRCLNRTLHTAFPQVATLPGDPIHFFASSGGPAFARDAAQLVERMRARRLRTSYVSEYTMPFRVTADRVLDLEEQILPGRDTPVNRDFAPIAYYLDLAFWSSLFSSGRRQWLPPSTRVGPGGAVVACVAALFVLVLPAYACRSSAGRTRAVVGSGVAAMGMTMIALELMLLLGFQSLYGYVYHQLSIIIAAFMAGMALGSWCSMRARAQGAEGGDARADLGTLAGLQVAAAVSPVILCLMLVVLGGVKGSIGVWLVTQILFPALALLCGFLGGFQFPLAGRIYFGCTAATKANPGAVYAFDLAGSCVGAIVFSVYLIPVYGFFACAFLIALVNLFPAAATLLAGRRT